MISRREKNEQIAKDIVEEEIKGNIKKYSIVILKILSVILVIFVPLFIYMRYFATSGIIVKETALYYENLEEDMSGIKIVQFSDLNYGSTVFKKEVDILINKINTINPDIVLFTGDLIANNYTLKEDESEYLIKKLNSINAKIGKYAVFGDNDDEVFTKILNSTNFIVLNNSYDSVYYQSYIPLLIVGINSSSPDLGKAYEYYSDDENDKNVFNLTIMHEPDTTSDILANIGPNLILAGHSLNGSIRLPFIGCLNKGKGYQKYCEPYYEINSTTKLYISSGIGTNNLKFRFLNKPSINLFRIRKK